MAEEADDEIQALFEGNKITESTYFAMQRKIGRLLRKLDFLREQSADNFVERVLNHLTRGESVVVEFGRYGNDLPAYVFVANFLTRRIHARYVQMKERAEGGSGEEPKKLVIAIEEAHKFLEPERCRVHHLRHHRPRVAQIQRHIAHRRPAPQPNLDPR